MSLFRVEGATPDENDESTEHSLAARLAAVRATAEEAQTTVDASAAQYQTLIREQVDFHANYVPAFDNDPAFAAAPAPAPGLPAAPAARRGLLCDGDDDDVVPLMEARAPPPAASDSESDDEGPAARAVSPRRRGGVLDDGGDADPARGTDDGGAHPTTAPAPVLDDGAADAAPAPRRAPRGGILDDGAGPAAVPRRKTPDAAVPRPGDPYKAASTAPRRKTPEPAAAPRVVRTARVEAVVPPPRSKPRKSPAALPSLTCAPDTSFDLFAWPGEAPARDDALTTL